MMRLFNAGLLYIAYLACNGQVLQCCRWVWEMERASGENLAAGLHGYRRNQSNSQPSRPSLESNTRISLRVPHPPGDYQEEQDGRPQHKQSNYANQRESSGS